MGMKAKISLLALMIATVAGAIAFDKFHSKTTAASTNQADAQKPATPVRPAAAERPPSHGGLTPVRQIVAAQPPTPRPSEPTVHVELPTPPAESHATLPAPPTPPPTPPPQPPTAKNDGAIPPVAPWNAERSGGTISFGTNPNPPKDSDLPKPPPSGVDPLNVVRPPDPPAPTLPKVTPPPPMPTSPTPAFPASPSPAPLAPDSYVIAPGDSLYVISQKVYGSPRHWKDIFEANKDTLASADDLVVGKKLHIPKMAAEPPKPPTPGASTPAPPASELAGKTTHTVKSGDSLSTISKLYYHDSKYWRKIATANEKFLKDPHDLKIGQVLVIPPMADIAPPTPPAAPGASTHAPAPPTAPEMNGKNVHVIAQGDSLSSISLKYFGTTKHWMKIFEANKGVLATPDDLVVGKKLVIPDLGKDAAPPASHGVAPAHDGGAPAPSKANGLPAQLEGKGTPYTVQEGDTLEAIAEKTLGHGSEWKRIFDLNKGVTMKDENHLSVGMVIAIPPKEEAPASHDRPPGPPKAPAPAKEPALKKAPPESSKSDSKEGTKERGKSSGPTHLIND